MAEDFSPNENDKAMERIKKLGPGTNKRIKSFQEIFQFLELILSARKEIVFLVFK